MKADGLFGSIGVLLMRIVFGLLMIAAHGLPKLQDYQEKVDSFADPLGIGPKWSLICTILTELGCSILLVLGLATRLAAAALTFTFIVVIFGVHKIHVIEDGSTLMSNIVDNELAILYLFVYVILLISGPGHFSLDAFIARRRRKQKEKPKA